MVLPESSRGRVYPPSAEDFCLSLSLQLQEKHPTTWTGSTTSPGAIALRTSDTEAQENGSLLRLNPAPHPTRATRKQWKPAIPPSDPIGYLLADLVCMGAKLNDRLQVLIHNEPPIDITATPYQYLYTSILEAAARARTKAAQGSKNINQELIEIDKTATIASHKLKAMRA